MPQYAAALRAIHSGCALTPCAICLSRLRICLVPKGGRGAAQGRQRGGRGAQSRARGYQARQSASGRSHCQFLGLGDGFLNRADHIERGLGQVVIIAIDKTGKAFDRVFQRDKLAGAAGKDLGDEKGL